MLELRKTAKCIIPVKKDYVHKSFLKCLLTFDFSKEGKSPLYDVVSDATTGMTNIGFDTPVCSIIDNESVFVGSKAFGSDKCLEKHIEFYITQPITKVNLILENTYFNLTNFLEIEADYDGKSVNMVITLASIVSNPHFSINIHDYRNGLIDYKIRDYIKEVIGDFEELFEKIAIEISQSLGTWLDIDETEKAVLLPTKNTALQTQETKGKQSPCPVVFSKKHKYFREIYSQKEFGVYDYYVLSFLDGDDFVYYDESGEEVEFPELPTREEVAQAAYDFSDVITGLNTPEPDFVQESDSSSDQLLERFYERQEAETRTVFSDDSTSSDGSWSATEVREYARDHSSTSNNNDFSVQEQSSPVQQETSYNSSGGGDTSNFE